MSSRPRTRRFAIENAEEPSSSAPPPLVIAEEAPISGELSLKREFDSLFNEILGHKRNIFAAKGDTARKAALVELEDGLVCSLFLSCHLF